MKMHYTDDKIFIHMNKNAGTFITGVMESSLADYTRVRYQNSPCRWIPEKDRDHKLIGSIRNPFDWYVSLWAFSVKSNWRNHRMPLKEFTEWMIGDPKLIVSKQYHSEMPSNKHLGAFSYVFINFFSYNALNILSNFPTPSEFANQFSEWIDLDDVIRLESIESEMVRIYGEHILTSFNGVSKNRSEHDDYRKCFTAELRVLIEEKDRAVLDAYGYLF